jgi:hypothetical protein
VLAEDLARRRSERGDRGQAYRLLKAILNTAVDDGLIRRNPCRIKGAGQERSPERPVLAVPQVYALADAVGDRYRALVLLAVFGSLRWVSWPRCAGLISTSRRVPSGFPGSSASNAAAGLRSGRPSRTLVDRTVAVPSVIIPDLASHIVTYAAPNGSPLDQGGR